MTERNEARVITPVCRLSYPAIFRPAKPVEGGESKYQCELIFPAGTDLSELKKAANHVAIEKWGAGKIPKNIRSPFREGDKDREGKDGYEGCVFIGARSKDRPGVVIGREREICTDESQIYGGCWVKASVTAFAYDSAGNKGVNFALNNIWKVRDGEPFGSRRNAVEEFGEAELDEESFGPTAASSLI